MGCRKVKLVLEFKLGQWPAKVILFVGHRKAFIEAQIKKRWNLGSVEWFEELDFNNAGLTSTDPDSQSTVVVLPELPEGDEGLGILVHELHHVVLDVFKPLGDVGVEAPAYLQQDLFLQAKRAIDKAQKRVAKRKGV